MSISLSISIGLVVVCLIASGLGAFVRWVGQRANWPDWLAFWAGLFVAFLVLLALKA